jgi:hypothetical protein
MTTWHCKHCSYSTRSWTSMASHSRKKHPSLMKHEKSSEKSRVSKQTCSVNPCPFRR